MSAVPRVGLNNGTTGCINSSRYRSAGINIITEASQLMHSNVKPEYGTPPVFSGQTTLPAVTKFKPQDYQTPIGHWFLTQRTTSDRRPRPVGVF